MLVYYFVPFIVSNRYLLFRDSNGHNSVTVQNRTYVYMNFFDHKDLGNHLLQLCPKVVKHPVCIYIPTYLPTYLHAHTHTHTHTHTQKVCARRELGCRTISCATSVHFFRLF